MPSSTVEIVSIVIPTLNRAKPLRRALESLNGQLIPKDIEIEIIVVDNSAEQTAQPVVDEAKTQISAKITYVSETVAGIANARNAGVAAASGAWIAFLDDDEEASPQWIAEHIATLRHTSADASFGPVEARADNGVLSPAFRDFFSRQISRENGSEITSLAAFLGTNNSVFNRASCFDRDEIFDRSLNDVGGEDSLLLKQLVDARKTFAWSSKANVTEWVPDKRVNWNYVRRRRFLSGQIRTFVYHKLAPPVWSSIVLWMIVGAAQCLVETMRMLAFYPINREKSQISRSKALGGLGKVLWGKRFRPKLYGAGLVS
jgi:succinoglycan biosynthesis protein ExoM